MVECSVETKRGDVCLPDLISCENLAEWNTYLNDMYNNVFIPDFLNSHPTFNGRNVVIRKEPRDGVWEHGFTHMTHEDYMHTSVNPNNRIPDLRRTERLVWVKTIIEKYDCSVKNNCGEILYWEEMYRGRVRCNLLYEKERFLVVLERTKNIYLIITSFYLDTDWALKKRLKKHKQYQEQKTPLA